MSRLIAAADAYRARLLAEDQQAVADLTRAYAAAWRTIQLRLRARLPGLVSGPTAEQQLRAARLLVLEREIAQELARFGVVAESRVTTAQRQVLDATLQAVPDLVRAALADAGQPPVALVRLPREAMIELVGQLQNGQPLRATLDTFGPQASQAAINALTTGTALGQPIEQIAAAVERALGVTLTRALTLSRTALLNASREATRRSYAANADIVRGWVWLSARTPRTCAVCWAMHGTEHPLDEPFGSHPNCRCTMVPALIGAPNPIPRGADLFAALDPADQRAVLGQAKHARYVAGTLTLADLVRMIADPVWGLERTELPLRALHTA